jgi:hypothetical protein
MKWPMKLISINAMVIITASAPTALTSPFSHSSQIMVGKTSFLEDCNIKGADTDRPAYTVPTSPTIVAKTKMKAIFFIFLRLSLFKFFVDANFFYLRAL